MNWIMPKPQALNPTLVTFLSLVNSVRLVQPNEQTDVTVGCMPCNSMICDCATSRFQTLLLSYDRTVY